ncbi:MAG: sulfurtransferase [Rhodospirillaceae bacterium]|nr:sulfurtransferase [Rhodospirillaceae bacterium]
MLKNLEPQVVKEMLSDGQEIAFFDVREHGQFGDGHPFFAVSVPYSRFEVRVVEVAPVRSVRMVLYDNGDGIAELAGARAEVLGYTDVSIMVNGAAGWKAAGFTLFKGENVPTKAFGEILELEFHTPNLTSEEVVTLTKENPNHIIVDSRPYDEYHAFNIPGGICCPNGEAPLRIGELVPDPETTIIVNCAGRTRSILGAETLRAFGVPNPVYALQNGTQGWFIAGLKREEGATRSYPEAPTSEEKLSVLRAQAKARADKTGLNYVEPEEAATWLADPDRSTFLIDVRSREEYEADGLPNTRHGLGGQLVQAIDLWVGVRGARIILIDNEMVRAPMMANWLYQIGHDVHVLNGGVDAMRGVKIPKISSSYLNAIPTIMPSEHLADVQLVDIRSPRAYRAGHIEGAVWSVRPLLEQLGLNADEPVVVIASDDDTAALAAQRFGELGFSKISQLSGDAASWEAAGLKIVPVTTDPADDETINIVYHWQHRNNPNGGTLEAAHAYLDWEIGLVDQLDKQERASFRLSSL